MVAEVPAATPIVVDAWVLLVAAASIVVTMLSAVLATTVHLAGRIDHQGALLGGRIDHHSDEIALVRERVARLEALFARPDDSSGSATEPPPADE